MVPLVRPVHELLIDHEERSSASTCALAAVVGQALAAYLGSRKAADKDPPFQLLVRGKAGARFPTADEILLAEEDEDRVALAIPKLKRRATP